MIDNIETSPVTLALSKGRIFDETMPLLALAGIKSEESPANSRRLVFSTSDPYLRLIIVRPSDVPTYVQYGAADFGIAGKDVILEHTFQKPDGLYQPIDLNMSKCKLSLAVRRGFDYYAAIKQKMRLRVATKYIQSSREYFSNKGIHVELIKLYGSIELAPLVGLADAIVDLVSTGNTLRANDLEVIEDIMPISSRLIVNRASLKTRRTRLKPFLDAFWYASNSSHDSKNLKNPNNIL
ncbi:MAG: ATP phosphoribosyltransferase [Bordetella sp.]|nr:MAG: ATP phosphoribosyltransferase [Bordetella sp.]